MAAALAGPASEAVPSFLLVGGGGHCRAVIDVLEGAGLAIGGVVDRPGPDVLGYPVLGNDDALEALRVRHGLALVTVGQIRSCATRERLFERLAALGFTLPPVASARAHVSRHAALGPGTVVMHDALVNAGAVIGRNGIVNTRALVEHDAVIGDHCHLSTGSIVNGNVRVGDGSFVGSGAVVREGVRIGRRCVIGMGVRVLRDVPDNTVYTG